MEPPVPLAWHNGFRELSPRSGAGCRVRIDTVLSWQNTALVMAWVRQSGALRGVRHQNVTKDRVAARVFRARIFPSCQRIIPGNVRTALHYAYRGPSTETKRFHTHEIYCEVSHFTAAG